MLLLLALLLVVPIVEITVIVQVASVIGGWNAIGLLILVSLVGAWLVRHEGFVVWRRLRATLAEGRLPGEELIDAGLVLAAGLLMLVPGFVTAAVGLLLLFPPTRAAARAVVKRRFRSRVTVYGIGPGGGRQPSRGPGRWPGGDDVIDV